MGRLEIHYLVPFSHLYKILEIECFKSIISILKRKEKEEELIFWGDQILKEN